MDGSTNVHSFPYYPSEHYDDTFTATSGSRIIDQDYRVVTENVLDMLHISYVHSFGNINQPLPFNIHYQQTSDVSGKTTFQYHPFNYTISMMMGNDTKVVVENEFILPTTTKNKTLFFYTVYRNFWFCRWKGFDWVNRVFDMFMKTMMDLTISEDIAILKHVNPKYRVGSIVTKYDVTIQQFRMASKQALEKYHRERSSSLLK
jgi:phenylpropionate dioxygenase-like ring-hydroxylating dioxygenase large terminal subunit